MCYFSTLFWFVFCEHLGGIRNNYDQVSDRFMAIIDSDSYGVTHTFADKVFGQALSLDAMVWQDRVVCDASYTLSCEALREHILEALTTEF